MTQVKRLLINYKTLEEFKQFKEYGIQELSMLEDLESNMIENDSNSPFYGIYFGDKLVARMSLYQVDGSTISQNLSAFQFERIHASNLPVFGIKWALKR